MPTVLDLGITSCPFRQFKRQSSVWLYLLHTSSYPWIFFDSESVMDGFGQWNTKGTPITLSLKAKC